MRIKILAFAQAQDQLGFREQAVDYSVDESPRELLARIAPGFDGSAMRVAVDHEYCDWNVPIGPASELALIPPVSGG